MHYTEFKIFDRFVTSALPIDRALLYGISCTAITEPSSDGKIPAQVMFSRENPNNPEDFNLRANPDGTVNMGSWIKRPE